MILYPAMPSVSPLYPNTYHLQWYTKAWRFLTVPTFWDMQDDYIYQLPDGTALLLPYQFRFDGASTPRPIWPLINPTGCLFIPGGFHDFWYRFGCLLKIENFAELKELQAQGLRPEEIREAMVLSKYGEGAPRDDADRMFQRIGNEITDLHLVNWMAYTALRHWGWIAWNNCRKKEDQHRNQIDLWVNGLRHIGPPQSGDGSGQKAPA